jgi:hypothetical protein
VDLINQTLLLVGMAMLLLPLLRAIRTLNGMRHRVLYPLIRLRRTDGTQQSVVRKQVTPTVPTGRGMSTRVLDLHTQS